MVIQVENSNVGDIVGVVDGDQNRGDGSALEKPFTTEQKESVVDTKQLAQEGEWSIVL